MFCSCCVFFLRFPIVEVHAKTFSDEMMCCRRLVQNNFRVGGGTDEIRLVELMTVEGG